jgi:hypothetical protein
MDIFFDLRQGAVVGRTLPAVIWLARWETLVDANRYGPHVSLGA